MVTPNSRRAFLFGRRTSPTPWGQFCARLARTTEGAVRWDQDDARAQAWLRPRREADIFHARALCAEYGVCLALEGSAPPASAMPRGLLWLEPGADWAALLPGAAGAGGWRADAGCRVGALQDAGIGAVAGADPGQSVAAWFASRAAARWVPGQGASCGVDRIEVLLADGTTATLGPFGAGARDPLDSLTVQRMVPRLFELAGTEPAARWIGQAAWPARFRLDALNPPDGADVNLAWLLAGHGGCLAWVRAVWFACAVAPIHRPAGLSVTAVDGGQGAQSQAAPTDPADLAAAATLDLEVKQIIDPQGLFLPAP